MGGNYQTRRLLPFGHGSHLLIHLLFAAPTVVATTVSMARSDEAGGEDATVAVRLLCSGGGHSCV